jgi:hypothetical protein
LKKCQPAGFCEPHEVAAAVAFLASPGCGLYKWNKYSCRWRAHRKFVSSQSHTMSISIRKYILILFILSATVGLAQPAVVINDNFNSNAHGWWTGSVETYSMQVEGGKYVIRTTQKDNGRFCYHQSVYG